MAAHWEGQGLLGATSVLGTSQLEGSLVAQDGGKSTARLRESWTVRGDRAGTGEERLRRPTEVAWWEDHSLYPSRFLGKSPLAVVCVPVWALGSVWGSR